jgi:hypothetical protein
MALGGTHRISVTPQNGWEKNTHLCNNGLGGSSTGGELKTYYVVVPMAMMVEQKAVVMCFDKTKMPLPATYVQERRMVQRFDQSPNLGCLFGESFVGGWFSDLYRGVTLNGVYNIVGF